MFTRQDIQSIVLTKTHVGTVEALALYTMNFLRTFATSLPGIFVPIYLFGLPNKPHLFGTEFTSNFAWIALYYAIWSCVAALANAFLLRAVFRILGFKWSLVLSTVFLAGIFASLVMVRQHFYFVFLAAILSGLAAHFYWIPFHIFFVRKADTGGKFGEESALQMFMGNVAGAIGPLVAGIIIDQFGFRALFGIAIFFILCSAFPVLVWVNEQGHRDHDLWGSARRYLARPRTRRLTLAFMGNAIEGTLYDMAWPLLLYIVLKDFVSVGALATFSIAFSSLFILWLGRLIERNKFVWLQKASLVINALLYGVRLIPLTPLRAYAIDVTDRMNGKIYGVTFTTEIYDAAHEVGESDLLVYREFVMNTSRACIALVVIASLFFGAPWMFVFVLAMFASFLTLYVFPEKE